ncbi:hypothetical protein R1sor_022423 [Riccia sorocarpa]|uniref:Uncharacterized protein n=1 Tax=Riccia sorocarpa TaxID=122646 RepID=A0ABD3GLT8_9MARC
MYSRLKVGNAAKYPEIKTKGCNISTDLGNNKLWESLEKDLSLRHAKGNDQTYSATQLQSKTAKLLADLSSIPNGTKRLKKHEEGLYERVQILFGDLVHKAPHGNRGAPRSKSKTAKVESKKREPIEAVGGRGARPHREPIKVAGGRGACPQHGRKLPQVLSIVVGGSVFGLAIASVGFYMSNYSLQTAWLG